MKQTMRTLIPLAIVFAFLVATNFMYAAWSAPTGAPSAANNTPAPINVGIVDQVKNAALGVDGLAVFGTASIQTEVRSPKYCDENGINCFTATSTAVSGSGEIFAGGLVKSYNLKYSSNVASIVAQGVDWKVTLAAPPTGDTNYVVLAGGSSYGNVWATPISPTEFYISGVSSGGNRGLIPNINFVVYRFSSPDALTPASWVTGSWGICSGGTQTRTVQCIDDNSGAVVADALCSGAKPATIQSCGWIPGTCFIQGTKVTMADGTLKNIEDVVIGEMVQGMDNTLNEVLAYDRPMLAGRLLYSINNGPYFVTPEHPFFTKQGWKSISVEDLKNENPSLAEELEVTQLQIGDYIQRNDGSWEEVTTLESRTDDDQRLYNFRLDGNSTYYANGFLTHNK